MLALKTILASALLTSLVSAIPIAGDATIVKKQSIPYGTIIESCTVPGNVAITFDDGPYVYTVSA
jgi:hypothetical protein